jgi:hypothetical protein
MIVAEWSYEIQTKFEEMNLLPSIQPCDELVLEWELHDSMEFSIIHKPL